MRQDQQKWRNRSVEHSAVRRLHLVGATHFAARRLEYAAARVLEVFARTQSRLPANASGTTDFFDLGVGVRNAPVSRPKLGRLGPFVRDPNGVGEYVATAARRRLFGDIRAADRDANAFGERGRSLGRRHDSS